MKCFIAFTHQDAMRVQTHDVISPKLFSPADYVPLVDTLAGAVLAALTAPLLASMNSATNDTEWCVLEMNFTPEKVTDMFMSGILQRLPSGRTCGCGRLRCFGPIQLSDAAATDWTMFRLAKTGTDAWADRVFDVPMLLGSCFGCGTVGVGTWIASREFANNAFCSKCWHTWHKDTAFPSLFDQAVLVARCGLPESDRKRRKGYGGIDAMRL